MKVKNTQWISLLLLACFLTSCAVSNPKFFADITKSEDDSYGYSAENPITIKNGDLEKSINSSYYFISRLLTAKGNKLQIVARASVKNPNYNTKASKLTYAGQPISYGDGPLLDRYIMVPENESDTFKIYINPYMKGEIKIPKGLVFKNE
ncbi:hypothetical protein [Carboxylicivirga marina]|uniref:hypothetical protein n=1 Tax=Carboxylicivirga marina TaxID=2800988 RepID=UPI002592187C|nr:hypothetical protein [uncultured Carboxylicivirga sp.]